MKPLALLALFFPLFALANINPSTSEGATHYQCHAYTDNKVDGVVTTDNPPQDALTGILETPTGFSIHGGVFDHEEKLVKDPNGSFEHLGYNKGVVMTQEENSNGQPFFIFYFFADKTLDITKPESRGRGQVNRLVVLGECS